MAQKEYKKVEVVKAVYASADGKSPVDFTNQFVAAVAKNNNNFFFYSREQPRSKLLGGVDDPKKRPDCDLTVSFKLGSSQAVHTFHETQEILFGDMDAYWESITDVNGSVPEAIQDELLHRYRPLVWLDEQELSFPCRVEWYLPHVELQLQLKGNSAPEVRAPVKETLRDANDLILEIKYDKYLFRSSEKKRFMMKHKNPPATQSGEPKERVNQVPFYCNVVVNKDGDIHLNYYFFYAYNGAVLQGAIIPGAIANVAGTHQGDWELLTIILSPDGEKIRAVRGSRHSTASGQYYTRRSDSPEQDNGYHVDPVTGRVVIFSARESHAVYNVTGVQSRGHGGFVDDFCSRGFLWDPVRVVNMGSPARPRVPWCRYGGAWGKQAEAAFEGDGPEGPFAKDSFYSVLPAMSTTNCLPTYGSWYQEEGKQIHDKIVAAGTSVVTPKGAALSEKLQARVAAAQKYLQNIGDGTKAPAAVSRALDLGGNVSTNVAPTRDISSTFPFTTAAVPWVVQSGKH